MKLTLLAVGKSAFPFVRDGMEMYEKRIKRYVPYRREEITDVKGASSLSPMQVKEREADLILKKIGERDEVILLDERGRQFSSVAWSRELERWFMDSAGRNLVFVIGGAYGFSERIYQRASAMLSLSTMTFSHQIIRLFFTEQLYRALSLMRGEPYHNE